MSHLELDEESTYNDIYLNTYLSTIDEELITTKPSICYFPDAFLLKEDIKIEEKIYPQNLDEMFFNSFSDNQEYKSLLNKKRTPEFRQNKKEIFNTSKKKEDRNDYHIKFGKKSIFKYIIDDINEDIKKIVRKEMLRTLHLMIYLKKRNNIFYLNHLKNL